MSWKIKIGKNPLYPYLQIDNWYTEKELVNIWKEIDFYTSRDVATIEKAENTVVAHDEKGISKSNSFRFYLWDLYTPKGKQFSHILNCLYKQRSQEFKDLVKKAMPLHHDNYAGTNTDATMVSYYDEDQEYKPHSDGTQFTFVIWLHKEPKKYKGGDFKFTQSNQNIKCLSNRMVMFPSYLEHQVFAVKMFDDATFGDGRYCITHFFNWEAVNVAKEDLSDDIVVRAF